MSMLDTIVNTTRFCFAHKKKWSLFVLSTAFFLFVGIVAQSAFIGHLQSLITTLGAYIQALTDTLSTNPESLVGFSVVSYALGDAIVKQALYKIAIVYVGLFSALFLSWNIASYLLIRTLRQFEISVPFHSFKAHTIKNLKWFGLYIVYTLIYFGFNLKFSLIDQVILGSNWQAYVLSWVHLFVRLLFLLFILVSYTKSKRFFVIPNLNQLGIFVLSVATILFFDTLVGYLALWNSIFYVFGFLILAKLLAFFSLILYGLPPTRKAYVQSPPKPRLFIWQSIVLVLLLIGGYAFSPFFLLTGIEDSGVLVDRVDITNFTDLANVLRTTPQELEIISASGIEFIVIEFSDFDCPFCASAQSTVDELHARDNVFVYRRHFPITSLHPQSYTAAKFAECFHDLGHGANVRGYLYGTQNIRSRVSDVAFAQDNNVSISQVDECMSSQAIIDRVEHDISMARSLGVTATPTYYVVPLASPRSYQEFDGALIQEMDLFMSRWS